MSPSAAYQAGLPSALFVALVLLISTAAPASAQVQVSRSPAVAPALGTTIRGSTATTFSITTGGAVTRTAGNAIRLSTGSVTAPTITISCGLLNLSELCALRYVRVTITPVAGSAPASLTRFRVSNLSGTNYRTGAAPAEAAALTFDLNPLGLLSTITFKLGMDVQLAAGAASGAYTYDYLVSVQFVN